MSYKVILEGGKAVAYGPNSQDYNPTIGEGQTLEIQEAKPTLPNVDIMRQIVDLERQITLRRIRDSVTTVDGKTWLENIEAQIAALRSQMI